MMAGTVPVKTFCAAIALISAARSKAFGTDATDLNFSNLVLPPYILDATNISKFTSV